MIRKFLKDERGAYAMITTVVMVPIMGGLALAIDFAEMSRQRQVTLNALDATGIAAARYFVTGATETQVKAYAKEFFEANLGSVPVDAATLTVQVPTGEVGKTTMKVFADLEYEPYFLPAFRTLVEGGHTPASTTLEFGASAEIQLKNSLEVALVLDNSGSMEYLGSGSGQKRIDLLKSAAKQLIERLSEEAIQMKQVDKPVQFGIVPFSSAVNVGASHATSDWMDKTGVSPIHHENFDWSTLSLLNNPLQYAEKVGSVWYARGLGWGTQQDKPLTRFSIYDKMQKVATKSEIKTCISFKKNGIDCKSDGWAVTGYNYTFASLASWTGCVEARPHPYNVNDTPATTGTPATMFVPMFAPDETDTTDSSSRPANNNWWKDNVSGNSDIRQRNMAKYFKTGTDVGPVYASDQGPNTSCGTKPITPLTDVTVAAGLASVKADIDAMVAKGATNVPEGLAWGWRVVSGAAPFTEGRPDNEKGVDKVVIVLTDGANTYYTPTSVTAQEYSGTYWNYGGNDLANAKAIYSAYGYLKPYSNASDTRLFQGTTVSTTDFSNTNYSTAMNQTMAKACANAKGQNILVMAVALDLDSSKTADKAQIDGLYACASESRYRKGADGKPSKLFWNAKGSTLSDTFEEIADELSNLRIIG